MQSNNYTFACTIHQIVINMKYQSNKTKGMAWAAMALFAIMLHTSCSRQESNRFVFHSSEEAVAACHKQLAAFREVKDADTGKLTSVVSTWLELQDSVYTCLSNDTTIHSHSHLTTDYYSVADSIRGEILRIAKTRPRSLHDVTFLKIHTAIGRDKTRDSQDYKQACKMFNDMDKCHVYDDIRRTIETYNALLDTTAAFSKEHDVVMFLKEEDRCFRSLMNHLSEVDQEHLAAITDKTSRLFDDLYARVVSDSKNEVSERMTLFLTMRFNRRILQNAEACMRDIKARKQLDGQQRNNYRWMLIQPFMSIDNYSMASLTTDQEESFLRLAEELPSLFAYLDGTPEGSDDLNKMKEILSDFFLSSYLKSVL